MKLEGPGILACRSNPVWKELLTQCRCVGSFPPSWSQLASLTLLYCPANSLSGTLPAEYGNLANLTYFNISQNNITGMNRYTHCMERFPNTAQPGPRLFQGTRLMTQMSQVALRRRRACQEGTGRMVEDRQHE